MTRLIFCLLVSSLLAAACHPKSAPAPTRPTSSSRPPVTAPTPSPPSGDRPTLPMGFGEGQIRWTQSEMLMPVLEEAQRVGKPVFVEFSARWCAPCKVMEEEIFTQRAVYDVLNRHFINLRLDYDLPTAKNIGSIYEVSQLPTILMLDPQGVVLQRHVGMMSVADFQRMSRAVGGH